MKFLIHRLQRGQIVNGEVVDILSHNEVIVNFRGDLVRVSNQSGQIMEIGQILKLKVTSVHPLSFQLNIPRGRLDKSI